MNLKSTLNPTKHDIQAIAEGKVVVDTSKMSPMEALSLGLAVQDFKEQHDLVEKDFKIDYDSVGEFMSNLSKTNRENQ